MTIQEDAISFSFPVLKATQPIGEFYIGIMDCKRLCEITEFDVRRILREREVETYLGIQRPLDPKRVEEITQYVRTIDACFPTAVILAIPALCASFDADRRELTLSNHVATEEGEPAILYRQIARVLDGQHRIEGLKGLNDRPFDVNVCIFIEMDIAEQAYIFSTVNLAQTKVNKSLVYDLFDLAETRSPQKMCHNIAVALDSSKESPFFQRIKRLGVATEGRFGETITQATFVQSLLKYVSKNPVEDRDIYKRGRTPQKIGAAESKELIFRNMMIDGRDLEITDILWNYFDSVRQRWPTAWNFDGRGMMLNKTNGFKGLMRFLRDVYLYLTVPGKVPAVSEFSKIFAKVKCNDDEFTIERFRPGTSGEVDLYRFLKEETIF